ncbi:hypothetical protein PYW08_014392 [Mythimna loreyi]|uniref:Uncharacterized protein n=1 Tax=Mythimna loreyi TaxID=667449 RepID=A0ACC2R7X2_9NEOP|nr:hypothetical protein PYW08_014392 [Mythimna loreyi]
MVPIKVFVFMDFGCVRKQSENLTEVALLAVPRDQYLEPYETIEPPNKLYCDLREEGFSIDIFKKFKDFLEKQEKPICLVSHSGMDLDFQILKRELNKLKVSLPDDLYCADSLYAFFDILREPHKTHEDGDNILLNFKSDSSINNLPEPNNEAMANQEEFDAPSDAVASYSMDNDKETTEIQDCDPEEDSSKDNLQQNNEKTPEKQIINATDKAIKNQQRKRKSSDHDPGLIHAKRSLFNENEHERNEHIYKGRSVRRIFYQGYDKPDPGAFTLGNLYKNYVKFPEIKAHPVENDVLMKFRISYKLGKRFLAWTDQVQLKFASVPKRKIKFPKN